MIYQHIIHPLLARLEKIEQEFIEQFSSTDVIENVLLLGSLQQINLLKKCHAQHRYLFCQTPPHSHAEILPICQGKFTALPYAKESIDLAIMPHTLEFSTAPQIIINEISTCLSQHGRLLLFSFSTTNRFITMNQAANFSPLPADIAKKIIIQAGLEIMTIQSFFSPLSCFTTTYLQRLIDRLVTPYVPFLCDAYLILAKKTIIPCIPLGLKSYSIPKLSLVPESACST